MQNRSESDPRCYEATKAAATKAMKYQLLQLLHNCEDHFHLFVLLLILFSEDPSIVFSYKRIRKFSNTQGEWLSRPETKWYQRVLVPTVT